MQRDIPITPYKIVKADNGDAWLEAQGPTGCELRDVSDARALLALQGPQAASILQALTPRPDVAYLLLISVEESSRRSEMRERRYQDSEAELQKRLKQYKLVAEQFQCRGPAVLPRHKLPVCRSGGCRSS